MNDILRGSLLLILFIVIAIYIIIPISHNPQAANSLGIEHFSSSSVINNIRDKYSKYALLDVPISMTDYGRTCVNWQDANNPAYANMSSNKCSSLPTY